MHHIEHRWFNTLDSSQLQMLQLHQQQMRGSCRCCSSSNNRVVVQMQCWQQFSKVSNNTDATHIRVAQWLVGSNGQPPDISDVTGDDAETMCCGNGCSTRTLSSLRGSVSFCSIRCVLALKFCGEARIHDISKTQKLFLEIPPRDDLIRLLVSF